MNKEKRTLFMIFGITLLVTMGISSLIPVLPTLAKTFSTQEEGSWRIIAAFALPGFFCIPLVGVWADRYGRKAVLIPALLTFAIGGVCCMFARTFTELLICRIIQGAGSAPLGLLYATIIADCWQGAQRARIMGYNAMVLGLGTALSPAVGGALAMLHWRLPFILPLLALPVAWLAAGVPLMTPVRTTTLRDYLVSTGKCFQKRETLTLLTLTLLTFVMLSGPLVTCFPLLAEKRFTASSLETGLIIAAASLASGLAASQLSRLYVRFSPRILFLSSFVLYLAAFCTMPLCPGLWWLVLPVLFFGFGQGLNIPLAATLLASQAQTEQRAALMAANAMLLRLAQNIGPALFGTLALWKSASWAIAAGSLVACLMALLVIRMPLPPACTDREKGLETTL